MEHLLLQDSYVQNTGASLDFDRVVYDSANDVVYFELAKLCQSYDFVDLGLPSGLKWATCNVGAKRPEESGLYFAWGETQGYTVTKGEASGSNYNIARIDPTGKIFATDFSDYEWYDTTTSTFTKYTLIGYNIEDTTSIKLLSEDDCATSACNKMRMPTYADFQELLSGTTNTWTDNYNETGVAGRIFSSITNSNSIFVPAAGVVGDGLLGGFGLYGYLWSSSLDSSDEEGAFFLYFDSGYCIVGAGVRYGGLPVRGVVG